MLALGAIWTIPYNLGSLSLPLHSKAMFHFPHQLTSFLWESSKMCWWNNIGIQSCIMGCNIFWQPSEIMEPKESSRDSLKHAHEIIYETSGSDFPPVDFPRFLPHNIPPHYQRKVVSSNVLHITWMRVGIEVVGKQVHKKEDSHAIPRFRLMVLWSLKITPRPLRIS